MFSQEIIQLSIVFMTALAVGGVVYVLVMPYLSGERKTSKRIRSVGARDNARIKSGAAADANQQSRRRQVQKTLKELEAKKKSTAKRPSLRLRLIRAGLTIDTTTFYIISAILGVALAAAVFYASTNLIFAGLAALVGAVGLPRKALSMLTKRRQKRFLEEFSNALDIIVRGVKSGLPLGDCLKIIGSEAAEPVRSEFSELCEQQRIGVSLAQGLEKMYERMALQEVNFFAIVLVIQQQSGGNLAETLGNLSQVLRDRKKLRGKVQAFSAEAKSSAAIIGSLPFIVMFLVYLTTPGYIAILWEEKIGQILMAICAMWMLCGIFIMRKMINFDY